MRLAKVPVVLSWKTNGKAVKAYALLNASGTPGLSFTLGDATQQTLREIWSGPAYASFREALLSEKPPSACASCGMRWSL